VSEGQQEEWWYRSLGGTPEPPEHPKRPVPRFPQTPLLTSPQKHDGPRRTDDRGKCAAQRTRQDMTEESVRK
jgi:hypothetical protein